jgi:hypothetical protein
MDELVRRLGQVVEEVAKRVNADPQEIYGRCRKYDFAEPRHMIMFFARSELGMNDKEIGKVFTDRDRTTVMSNIDRVVDLLAHGDRKMLIYRGIVSEVWGQIFTGDMNYGNIRQLGLHRLFGKPRRR